MSVHPSSFEWEVALSHDWLTGMRGGERCLEALCRLFPRSEIYTLLHLRGVLSSAIESKRIHRSFLQHLPLAGKYYKYYLPLLPMAVESLKVGSCDLVLSTSHCVAKGIRVPAGKKHICYCFTPMRYAWLFFDEYFGSYPSFLRALLKRLLGGLRHWDVETNRSVTHFIAISEHVRRRIRDFYERDASVIYPPVDTDFFTPSDGQDRKDFHLVVSALVPYKRVDLAIGAFNAMRRRLVVIGDGPLRKKLEREAGPTIEFVGKASNEEIRASYRSCRALVFPGEEDFGIVPVEAQACGSPAVAFGRGGALETVIAGRTGVFFKEQSVEALRAAVEESDRVTWDRAAIRNNAERFDTGRFLEEMGEAVTKIMIEKETLAVR